MTDIQTFLTNAIVFLNDYIIPLIIGVSFIFFLWNLYLYAIYNGTTTDGRERARRLMLWGVTAFVIMISVWGIVNLLVDTLNVNLNPTKSDYMQQRCIETGDPDICDLVNPEFENPPPTWFDDPCSQNPNAAGCSGSFENTV